MTTTQVRLHAGPLEVLFLPDQGMLGASLRHQGVELLGKVDDVAGMGARGETCGIPLLYPWANRVALDSFRVADREVVLDSPLLDRDDNGLANHGVPWSRLVWTVLDAGPTWVRAQLRWDEPQLLAVFPFVHRVTLDGSLDEGGLTLTTTVHADAGDPVPVSFGFHPFFDVPAVPRAQWDAQFPAMRQLLADERNIPTGQTRDVPALDGPLADRTYDDGFALLAAEASFSLAAGGRRLRVRFGDGYTHAQIFAPPQFGFIAIEPMTAPVNALVTRDGLRIIDPGESFAAQFRIDVE